MIRRAIVLFVFICACRALFAESDVDIIDVDSKSATDKKPAPVKKSSDAVDEPGFKASVKFAERPSPNYDPGTKNTNQITVPKRSAWSVPLEDGYLAPANANSTPDAAPSSDDKAQAASPEVISPTLAAAIAREKAGAKPKEMIAVYQTIVATEKDNAAPHYRLGLAQIRAGETQNGLVEMETAIALQPKNPRYLSDYGIAALKAGWVEKAYAACQAAINVSPQNARYHSALGDVHLAAQHIPDAVEAYTRAMKLDPENSGYFYNLGLAYTYGRDFKRAAELFNEAIRLKPSYSPYYCSRGLACENLKNYKQAIQDYTAAIKFDKNNPYAHYLYAGIFSDPDDPTYTNRFEAVEHAEKAVKLSNFKNAQYLMGLARALRVAHNYEQAVDIAKKALELEPTRSDYRKELAQFEQLKAEGFTK